MKRFSFALVGALALLSLSCNDLGDGGGGPGGGFVFTSGYVYVRSDTREVFIVDNASTGAPQQLTNNTGDNHTPSISPDGRIVVFAHGTSTGPGEIDSVPTTGTGTPAVVFAGDAGHTNLRDPVVSPDGSQVAFVYDQNGISYVATVSTTGGNFVPLTSGASSVGSPSWYSDGKTLLVASGSSPANLTQLQSLDMGTQTLSAPVPLGAAILDRAVLSPDNTSAVFNAISSSANRPRIFTIALATRAVSPTTDHPGDESSSDGFPAWVGNTQVVFNSDSGGAQQVYVTGVNPTVPGAGSLAVPSAVEAWFH